MLIYTHKPQVRHDDNTYTSYTAATRHMCSDDEEFFNNFKLVHVYAAEIVKPIESKAVYFIYFWYRLTKTNLYSIIAFNPVVTRGIRLPDYDFVFDLQIFHQTCV